MGRGFRKGTSLFLMMWDCMNSVRRWRFLRWTKVGDMFPKFFRPSRRFGVGQFIRRLDNLVQSYNVKRDHSTDWYKYLSLFTYFVITFWLSSMKLFDRVKYFCSEIYDIFLLFRSYLSFKINPVLEIYEDSRIDVINQSNLMDKDLWH